MLNQESLVFQSLDIADQVFEGFSVNDPAVAGGDAANRGVAAGPVEKGRLAQVVGRLQLVDGLPVDDDVNFAIDQKIEHVSLLVLNNDIGIW